MTTPLQKAAEQNHFVSVNNMVQKAAREAAEEITQDEIILCRVGIPKSSKKGIIIRHLEPVQKEIEAYDLTRIALGASTPDEALEIASGLRQQIQDRDSTIRDMQKELDEAREIIEGRTMLGCDCSVCEEAQSWLARNPIGKE